jgi:hypothetical protein
VSAAFVTLEPEYAAAERFFSGSFCVWVPSMRITVVHGLRDGNPTMMAALPAAARRACLKCMFSLHF